MSLSLLNAYDSDSSDGDDQLPSLQNVDTDIKTHTQQPQPEPELQPQKYTKSETSSNKQFNSIKQPKIKKQRQRKRRNKEFENKELPTDLLEELQRTGYNPSQIDIIDVNVRSTITPPTGSTNNQQLATTSMVHKTADRIVKSTGNVSKLERRRHQITALAAEATALQVARHTFPNCQRGTSKR